MSLNVNYTLDGAGWASCTVISGEIRCEITASYLSDALGNLVASAVATLSGHETVSTSFDEEPGEYRWVLEPVSPKLRSLQILEFPELWGNKPNSEGKSVFRVEVTALDFGKAIYVAATKVLEKHGADGYAKSWIQHQFPHEGLRSLEKAIARHEHAA